MNIFVIAGLVFMMGTIGWYAWFTSREARSRPPVSPPTRKPDSAASTPAEAESDQQDD
jgi:hypothetical protein